MPCIFHWNKIIMIQPTWLFRRGLGSPSTSVPISTSMVDVPLSPGVPSTLNLDTGQNWYTPGPRLVVTLMLISQGSNSLFGIGTTCDRGAFSRKLWSNAHIHEKFHIWWKFSIYLMYSQNRFLVPYIYVSCFIKLSLLDFIPPWNFGAWFVKSYKEWPPRGQSRPELHGYPNLTSCKKKGRVVEMYLGNRFISVLFAYWLHQL